MAPCGRKCVRASDAWHIHKLPLLRRAFPATSWTLCIAIPLKCSCRNSASPGNSLFPEPWLQPRWQWTRLT